MRTQPCSIHVVPANDGWAVEAEGDPGDRQVYDTQEAAIAAATERAREKQVELFIHCRDGKIRERNTYGDDPPQAKG